MLHSRNIFGRMEMLRDKFDVQKVIKFFILRQSLARLEYCNSKIYKIDKQGITML